MLHSLDPTEIQNEYQVNIIATPNRAQTSTREASTDWLIQVQG